ISTSRHYLSMILLDFIFTLSTSFTLLFSFFFFNDPATTEIYTLSLHDALPIFRTGTVPGDAFTAPTVSYWGFAINRGRNGRDSRSEEHTSELQSLRHLVCRLLLEKKKKKNKQT